MTRSLALLLVFATPAAAWAQGSERALGGGLVEALLQLLLVIACLVEVILLAASSRWPRRALLVVSAALAFSIVGGSLAGVWDSGTWLASHDPSQIDHVPSFRNRLIGCIAAAAFGVFSLAFSVRTLRHRPNGA